MNDVTTPLLCGRVSFVGDCQPDYRDPFFPSGPWHLLACQDEAVNTLLAS
jgi:hypothetical protein